jgi:tetratricopeptide (TPR) repeat protein
MWRKSQIAIEYAYRYHAAHPQSHVFWVYAANGARFDQAYKDIARKLRLPHVDDPEVDVGKIVSDWLHDGDNREWLMILDNADNPDLFFPSTHLGATIQVSMTKKPLADYLPGRLNSKRSILITTRNRQLGEDLSNGEPCIEILPFSLQEAAVLLRSKAGRISNSWNNSDSDELLEVLGCIPLAITQAAAFIKRNRMSLQKYQESLEEHEQNIKDYLNTEHQDHRRERGIPNAAFRTWELSYNQIREQEPRAAAMLSLMAMLDRQQIPEHLLRRHNDKDVEFFRAIGTLDGLSLITKEVGKETCTIHRLVQLSVHVWLEQHNQKTQFEEEALSQLAGRFPDDEYVKNRELCESLLPHARAVLRYDLASEPNKIRRADLLYNISGFHGRQGRYDQAYTSGLEAYNVREMLLGQEDSRTLNSLSWVASMLQDQGKYAEAEKMHRRDLEGSEKMLGVEHPDTLTSVSNLGSVLQDQGKYEAAEEMHRRALKGREKVLGVEHPYTLTSVSHLGSVLRFQGKYHAAEEMRQRTLKRKRPNSQHTI